MNTSDLSRRVDPYKLADQKASINRRVPFSSLPRIIDLVGNPDSQVDVEMHFQRDENHRCLVQGRLEAVAEVICERCLNPVEQTVESDFTLCVVHSDEAARDIPREYDPFILTEPSLDIVDIVEDEILLALPMFSYHADPNCDQGKRSFGDAQQSKDLNAEGTGEKPNPFSVLSTLKLKK